MFRNANVVCQKLDGLVYFVPELNWTHESSCVVQCMCYVCMYVYTYVYVCVYVCMCVYINMCVCTYVMCVCSLYLLLPQNKASHYVWPVYATIKVCNKLLALRECGYRHPRPSSRPMKCSVGGSHSLIHLVWIFSWQCSHWRRRRVAGHWSATVTMATSYGIIVALGRSL
jgi:hypothetical protein